VGVTSTQPEFIRRAGVGSGCSRGRVLRSIAIACLVLMTGAWEQCNYPSRFPDQSGLNGFSPFPQYPPSVPRQNLGPQNGFVGPTAFLHTVQISAAPLPLASVDAQIDALPEERRRFLFEQAKAQLLVSSFSFRLGALGSSATIGGLGAHFPFFTHSLTPPIGNCQDTGSAITISGTQPGTSGNPNIFSPPVTFWVFGTTGTTQFFGSPWGTTGVVQYGTAGIGLNTQYPMGSLSDPVNITVNGIQVNATLTYLNPPSTEMFVATATQTPAAPAQCATPAPTGDDISTDTGDVYLDFDPDLDLGGGPLRLRFQRYYDALLGYNGISSALGAGWMDNFDTSMAVSGSNATVVRFGGKTVRFQLSGGVWQLVTPERYADQLVQNANQYEYYSIYDDLIYTFNSSGALTGIGDRNGNQIAVTPGAHGPTQASDGLGRTLTFTYNGSHLSTVMDQTGRSISFTQTTNNLTGFTNAAGQTTTYAYLIVNTGSVLASTTPPLGNTIYTQAYSALGQVTKQTDGLGNATALAYPTPGEVTTVTDALGNVSTYEYTIPTLITMYTDALGKSGGISYDASGRPTAITDRNGNRRTVAYEAVSGLPASVTDQDGHTTSFTYTASVSGGFTAYDLTGVTYADGSAETYARDSKGNLTLFTDAAGYTTGLTYNPQGQPLTIVNALNGTTALTYNQDGTPASLKTPAGNTTTFAYDNLKRPIEVINPDASAFHYGFDALDRLVQATDERSDVTAGAYDANGQHTSTTDALNQTTSFAFDGAENLTAVTTPVGTTAYSYNADELVKTITAPTGETRTFGYDADLRTATASDAVGQFAAVSYDNETGLTSYTDGAGRKFVFTPDPLELLLSATTPLNETSQQTYDKRNRLATATDALGEMSTFTYEPRGYLSAASVPGPLTASYTRNGLGEIVSLVDANGNTWTRSYDSTGREISETDPDGNTVSYTYDSRDRRITETSSVATVQYSYDAASNRTASVYSDNTSLAYTYDADNRATGGTGVTETLDALGFIVNSNGLPDGRDRSSRLNSITYPGGQVTYTYNNRGLLSQVSDWAGGNASFTYNAALQVTSIARSNGVTTTYTYDADGRLASIAETAGGVNLASIVLQRDALGRVTGETRTQPQGVSMVPGVVQFTYDAASEVSGSAYDALGRLTRDSIRSYTFDAASRLTGYTGGDGAASFTYDAYGMRTSRTSSGTTQNYIVNYGTRVPTVAVVQLVGAAGAAGVAAKTAATAAPQAGAGAVNQQYYVYTPDGMLLYWIDASSNAHHFFHFDELWNTLMLTADSGAVTDSYGITPYGESVTQNGSTANPFTWQGAWGAMQEGSTSLYYLRARYYDSTTGRFLSRDRIRHPSPRAIDPYEYALGDPVDFVDPTGLNPLGTPAIVQSATSPLSGSGTSPKPPAIVAGKNTCDVCKYWGIWNYCDGNCPNAGETCQPDRGWMIGDTWLTIDHCSCF
jgi:RHS repeat-associated protein